MIFLLLIGIFFTSIPFFYAWLYPLFFLQTTFYWYSLCNTSSSKKLYYGFGVGFLVQSINCVWVVLPLYNFANMPSLLGIMVALGITGGVYTSLWFYLLQIEQEIVCLSVLRNSFVTAIYWYCMIYLQFWYTGCLEGNPFINPILVLIQGKRYLPGLCGNGRWGIVLWIFIISFFMWSLTYFFLKKRRYVFFVLATVFCFWPKQKYDNWLHQSTKIIFAQDLENVEFENSYIAQAIIAQRIKQMRKQEPYLLVFPESLYQYQITDEVLARFSSFMHPKSMVLLGTIFYDTHGKYNTVCVFDAYDRYTVLYKNHIVSCVERKVLRDWFSISQYCYDIPAYSSNRSILFESMIYEIIICSELYYHTYTPTKESDYLLFVHNHTWLQVPYIKKLSRIACILYAVMHNKKIIVN